MAKYSMKRLLKEAANNKLDENFLGIVPLGVIGGLNHGFTGTAFSQGRYNLKETGGDMVEDSAWLKNIEEYSEVKPLNAISIKVKKYTDDYGDKTIAYMKDLGLKCTYIDKTNVFLVYGDTQQLKDLHHILLGNV